MKDKFERYHLAQSWFAKNGELYRSSRHRGFEIICSKISEIMGVSRVGIWFFTIDREAIFEEMTFIKHGELQSGCILRRVDYPLYFQELNNERVLVSNDTHKDRVMSEFLESYSIPNKVYALLDSPIYSDGEALGILCVEDTNSTRDWDIMDINFAGACADLIGRLIESEKRHIYEKELRHRINYLENDLKKKLDDLNEAKLSLDLALESAQVGKWDWDLVTNNVSLNKTWYTKLGYDFNELPQNFTTFEGRLHPDDRARVHHELDRHIKGETLFYECRYRMITKAGDIQWCLDRGCIIYRGHEGQPLRLTGVNVNVTPMIKWEQSLITSEQQLKAMIQSLPTPVAMFDSHFQYVAFSSRWTEEWSNILTPPKEGQKVSEHFRKEWLEDMSTALQGKIVSRDDSLVEISPGVDVWLRMLIQPWKDANGRIGGVVMMAENITRRKETEIRLTQASKLSALGEMAGGIAHEINNPLGIIKGYIDLLRRHSGRQSLTPELLLQYINKMDTTVGRISRIVNGMRRFARESSMDEKVTYSVNKIIEETLDICQERINNNGTSVEVEYLKQDSTAYCRPVEVSQVILNLINNSYQATSEYTHPWIRVKAEDIGNKIKISVSDCGEGISPLVRKKLFQPFFTTKDVGVGTGLGLSISRGIIEEHKGKLYYQEDAPNTTFVIEIPKLDEAHASPAQQ
ncbi:MAG: ATP-binding protein [Bdellovibrionota bacterium]